MGCRRTDDQAALVRVASTASGLVVSRTAPGRGAWLHPGCGAVALKRRAITRALRAGAGDPAGLAAIVEQVDAPETRLGNSGS